MKLILPIVAVDDDHVRGVDDDGADGIVCRLFATRSLQPKRPKLVPCWLDRICKMVDDLNGDHREMMKVALAIATTAMESR